MNFVTVNFVTRVRGSERPLDVVHFCLSTYLQGLKRYGVEPPRQTLHRILNLPEHAHTT